MTDAETAGVRPSGEAMNLVYAGLTRLPFTALRSLFLAADPYDPAGAMLRHQILFTVGRLASGRWPPEPPEPPCERSLPS